MHYITEISKLLSDKSRVVILTTLMGNKALTSGELAIIANITPQTVSSHLSKLLNAGLVNCESVGKHKYYYLASDNVADLLETMLQFKPNLQVSIPSHFKIDPRLKSARTCYKHLAGNLGVTIASNLIKIGALTFDGKFNITPEGCTLFSSLGINLNEIAIQRKVLIKPCLDWTERKFHIGGVLGNELFSILLKNDWLRTGSIHRAVYLTELGKEKLCELKLI
ncbi:MAG: winged helix-turn-helix domain-containing protein [Burkholderiales bacterium]|nr:winged helix-turn-helix domain-containing protein [Burkholderiales bacterium]